MIDTLVQNGTKIVEERYEYPAEYDDLGNLIHEAYTEVVTREIPNMVRVQREETAAELAEYAEAERQVFEQEMANQGTIENKLELLLASIPTDTKPADRPGYRWKMLYNADGNSFGWEEIPDPYYVPTADGSYTNPFTFTAGMEVEVGKFYTDGNDIWECVQAGVAESFTAPWFEVIA